jgi:hypothetical protein
LSISAKNFNLVKFFITARKANFNFTKMGFEIAVNEDKDEVIVTKGDKMVSAFTPKGLKKGLKAQLEWSGGDYLR